MKLGLIGWPLGHSWSPEIHRLLINADYRLMPLEKDELDSFFEKRDFDGINVTIPYKSEVMKYLDEIDENAKAIGAVNTIVNRGGKLIGFNTDYIGLRDMILNAGIDLSEGKTAILGSGGGSKAAVAAVKSLSGNAVIVSRNPKDGMISYEDLYAAGDEFSCIINTTPVGLHPHTDEMPVDPAKFANLKAAVDIIANPLCTKFLLEAKHREIKALGGFEMLVRQAFAADEIFLNQKLDVSMIEVCMQELYRKRRNIVLIGMPTSGKTTFSTILSRMTGKKSVEMDDEAVNILGTSIADCFMEKGEAYFRELETEIAASLYEGKGLVISCGGGVVKTPETMRLLSHNGYVIWLQRDLSQLFTTDDRPLSKRAQDLSRLYEERIPLYSKYADCVIDNTGTIEDTIRDLLNTIHESADQTVHTGFHNVTVSSAIRKPSKVSVPSSKSTSHRALIAAALAEGTSVIHNLGASEDINATMNALRIFGAEFEKDGNDMIVHGKGVRNMKADSYVDCGESGTTLRFLIPLLALSDRKVTLRGHGRLMQRPQDVYEKIFRSQSLLFEREGDELRLQGPLKSGIYEVDGNISSQFISGLLLALPLLEGDSEIRIHEPFESSSYIRLTLDALKHAGIRIIQDGLTFRISGSQTYSAHTYTVPGDDSQAAFFACMALLNGAPVHVSNMDHHSLQGDHAIVEIMKKFGAAVTEKEEGYLFEAVEMKPAEIDLSDTPDLGPVLFALAAKIPGDSVFKGAGRLRIKESDRIASMQQELEKLGVKMDADTDTVIVHGVSEIEGGITVDGHRDHRIVMALSVLSCAMKKPLHIKGADAVRKSWPDFFRDFAKAGGKVTYD